jgi:PAS domain S-box-containing protein
MTRADSEVAQKTSQNRFSLNAANSSIAHMVLVLTAYMVAGKLGQATGTIRSSNLGPVWPAYGVALAAVLLCGYRALAPIAVGAFLVALWSPVAMLVALGQAAGTTLAAMSGTYFLRRLSFTDLSLSHLRDTLLLIVVGAFGSATVSASIGTTVLYTTHIHAYSGAGAGWLIYWLGDSTGVLLVTPLILTFRNLWTTRQRIGESFLVLLFLCATCVFVFGDLPFLPIRLHLFAFAVLPIVMWAAIRLGVAMASLYVLLVATIATIETALGAGPFASNGAFVGGILLDIFFGILSISGLTLASAIAEGKGTEREREKMVREKAAAQARLRLASIVESSDDAIIGANVEGTITDWNKGAERLFNYESGEIIGRTVSALTSEIFDQFLVSAIVNLQNREKGSFNRYEISCRKKNGATFEAGLGISPIFDIEGKIEGASIIVRDISARKRLEAVLRESESRFRLVADTAPVMIWMSDTSKVCTYFNKRWLDFTGRTLDSQLGNGWVNGIHEQDLECYLETYTKAFDQREKFRMEYRLRQHNGEYRWIMDHGVPRFDMDGTFAGYIGSCIDVTETKLAEEAISTVNRRLIAAQEQERIRIARDLHDDINQQLALLLAELDALQSIEPYSVEEVRTRLSRLAERLNEISGDIQQISHQLHSSKLEHLGLLTAMKSFCREFGAQQRLDIRLHYNEIPSAIPFEISLALFRVLQEGLRNGAKHSGVKEFDVDLKYASGEICLSIADQGAGFDPNAERSLNGLGLVSMRERVKLIQGTITIISMRNAGTSIKVCVRLNSLLGASSQGIAVA